MGAGGAWERPGATARAGTTRGGPFVVAAFVLALAASLILLFAPLASEVGARAPAEAGRSSPTGTEPTGTEPTGTEPTGTEPTGTEPQERSVRHLSLLQTEGPGIVVALAIPVVIAALPLLGAGSPAAGALRAVSATLLPAWVLLGIASIGTFYLPAAAAMAVGWGRGSRGPSAVSP